jgi:hypothetical protein
MTWITIKLMQLHLWLAKKKRKKQENDIVARAYDRLIKSYADSIMFLKADS